MLLWNVYYNIFYDFYYKIKVKILGGDKAKNWKSGKRKVTLLKIKQNDKHSGEYLLI